MKVDAITVKPAFVPVTITLQSVEELAFFRDVAGSTYGGLTDAYGLEPRTFNVLYEALDRQCTLQKAPGYKSQGYEIKFEAKGE